MNKLAHNLPLHDMLRGVIHNATTKLAEDEKGKEEKVKKLLAYEKKEHGGKIPTPAEEEHEEKEKMASAHITSDDYIEKLASACDFIAQNASYIEAPARGVITETLAKMAGGKAVPPAGTGAKATALATTEAIGGHQAYKKDQASTNTPEKEIHEALSAGGSKNGKTQLENNMHDAPGGGSISPTGKYPEKGPLVNLGKTANARDMYIQAMTKGTEKTAGEQARDFILAKLAGEDVMKANISSARDGGPSPGDGVQKVTQSGERTPPQAGGPTKGFGNQGRALIQSNSAAEGYTKKDAKGPVKEQLRQVLEEPALSAKTDSKLKENLRSTGEAGVKIAANRAILEKIASEGTPEEKALLRMLVKEKVAMGGMVQTGGMPVSAEAGEGAEGCTCDHTGSCRVCKLKAALEAARSGEGAGAEHAGQ